jgi:hypothetical protein
MRLMFWAWSILRDVRDVTTPLAVAPRLRHHM